VLIVRVHPDILRNEGLSEESRDDKALWEERYRSIVDLESHLYRNGTQTIKVFPTSLRKSSESDSSSALMSRTRTGNLASPTLTKGNIGNITCRLMSLA
jgi:hypothetical protein